MPSTVWLLCSFLLCSVKHNVCRRISDQTLNERRPRVGDRSSAVCTVLHIIVYLSSPYGDLSCEYVLKFRV